MGRAQPRPVDDYVGRLQVSSAKRLAALVIIVMTSPDWRGRFLGSYDVTIFMMALIVVKCVLRGRPEGGRAVIIVDFDDGGGGVGLAVVVICTNGNYGYSSSEISKIEC